MGFETDFEKWKQEYFGAYCMTQCDLTCCDMRNVSLRVTEKELKKLFGPEKNIDELLKLGVKKDGSFYSVETKDYCPKFDSETNKCLDYENRSSSCRAFPFVIESGAVMIKNGCPLNKGGKEYAGLAEIASKYGKVIVKKR